MFASAQPIVEDVSKLASVGSMLPGVGPIAASSAVLLNAISRLVLAVVLRLSHAFPLDSNARPLPCIRPTVRRLARRRCALEAAEKPKVRP